MAWWLVSDANPADLRELRGEVAVRALIGAAVLAPLPAIALLRDLCVERRRWLERLAEYDPRDDRVRQRGDHQRVPGRQALVVEARAHALRARIGG